MNTFSVFFNCSMYYESFTFSQLKKIKGQKITDFEKVVSENKGDENILKQAKTMGFSDAFIAKLWGVPEIEIFNKRKDGNEIISIG